MQSETAISRELIGKIVDEVFDGAIEDPSVIEEIYAVIKREEAAQSKIDERNPLDLNITQDWFEKRSALEADHEIGAGPRKLTACIDPTPDELAELFKIAHRIPDGWKLVPVAALSAAEPEPVAWYWEDKSGCYHITMDRPDVQEMAAEFFCDPKPLYAAPPSPSVAVKALRDVAHDAAVALNAVLEKPEDKDRQHHARYYLDVLRSALSAQVQDVAGWQPIESAPRDGTVILLVGGAYHGNPFTGYWELRQFNPTRPWVSVVNESRLYEHVPTHWMPLPTSPAKQEG
ncbi:hypothetical protein O9X81_05440 [Agrobacterium salinitolerans]|uniref:hypothetical protein n=1 Tax=Agrobacterium salinitolerans TaxID=1183413 RepID=UPI0022B80FB2|nr:hypothetical protein [Agrobacterium salinitolerans]MCZ7856050.1 hypothetical protein [Agrobacterium salinitolerans]